MRWKYFLDTRVLSMFGILAAIPIAVGFFLIQSSARARLVDSIGYDFYRLASYAASSVDDAVLREVLHLSTLSRSPDLIRAAAGAPSSAGLDMEKIQKLERDWSEYPTDHARVKTLLSSEASRHLAAVVSDAPIYHELMLVGASGIVTAASQKPVRFFFGDRPWFQEAITGESGEGALAISDVRRFKEQDTDALTLAWPVKNQSSEVVGVLRAVVDARVLFQPINGLRFGQRGHAMLVQGEGEVLAGAVEDCIVNRRYHAQEDVRRAIREKRPFFIAGLTARGDTENAELVGYARPQVASSHKTLDWTIVVEQPLTEAYGAISPVLRDILLYFVLMGLLVIGLALYYSFTLERPVTDIEMDLHHDLPKTVESGS